MREIKMTRADISEMENVKTIEKIKEISLKSLMRLTKGKRENIQITKTRSKKETVQQTLQK